MRTKHLFGILLLFISTIGFISCEDEDDGYRGFMQTATITGDSINGFYCYMDGGGFAISHDRWLTGIERGYFTFNYNKEDWKIIADNVICIDNAHVIPYTVYDVIRPISRDEAEKKQITDKDSCQIAPFLSVSRGYRGYFNLHTGLYMVNLVDLGKAYPKIHLVYDPEKLTSDTLHLQLCYNLRTPDKWTKTSIDYGSISCDISSFAKLKKWNDSVTIVVDTGDKEKHFTKISKNDFLKPDIKLEKR